MIAVAQLVTPVRQNKDTDATLLAEIARGDMKAFRAFHTRYHGRVFGFAMRMVHASDRADEIVNDTMMAVWTGASRFEGRSKVSSWVFGIAYRIALKSRRRFGFEWKHVSIDDADPIVDTSQADIETVFLRRGLAAALAKLPQDMRAIMELTYTYGMTCNEVSDVVGAPVGTVKSRMSRARALLRAELGQEYEQ